MVKLGTARLRHCWRVVVLLRPDDRIGHWVGDARYKRDAKGLGRFYEKRGYSVKYIQDEVI